MQACFQEHRTISKNGFTRTTVIELFNPIRPPQPPHFFKLYKATSSIILPAKTEPIWPLSERVIKTSCVLNGGGGLRIPPQLPRFSFYAVQICCQEHRTINQNCFKKPSCRQMGGLHPPQLSRFLNLCKIASSIILPAKTTHMDPGGRI